MTINIPPPNDKQKLFLKERHKYVAYGGARGGGKSWAVRVKAILLSYNYPGITIMIIRRSYPELYANHIKPLKKMLPKGAYKYNDSKKEILFPNGSQIVFKYCANTKDLDNFQGTECDVLFIDEATQFTEEQYKILIACVRGVSSDDNPFPKRVYLTCNPGGVGHGWVKRLFISRQFSPDEDPNEYSFVQAGVRDNTILMKQQPDYIRQLEALPPKLREAWLNGSWDIFFGQFFEEFSDRPEHYLDKQYTHVIEPFEIPEGWQVFRCFDWGYNKPFACEWFAMDYDGIMYNILELYGCVKGQPNTGLKWTPEEVFKRIRQIESENRWLKGKNIIGVADPAIWDAETGESIADKAAKYQIYFQKGDHKRIPGWMQMHYRFSFDENGYPMMYIFKNCEGTIRTIPTLIYDDHHPEDIDTDGEDHIADAIRYLCMSRPIKPRMTIPDDKYSETPMAMYLDIPKEDIIARPKREKLEVVR